MIYDAAQTFVGMMAFAVAVVATVYFLTGGRRP